jgi:hypothetical protein
MIPLMAKALKRRLTGEIPAAERASSFSPAALRRIPKTVLKSTNQNIKKRIAARRIRREKFPM